MILHLMWQASLVAFHFSHALFTGFFCEEWGLFEPTGPCQAGYYCTAGTLIRMGLYQSVMIKEFREMKPLQCLKV